MITQCTIQNLYKTKNIEAIELAKSFERRRCNHGIFEKKRREAGVSEKGQGFESEEQGEPEVKVNGKSEARGENRTNDPQFKSAFDCLLDVIVVNGSNKHRYVVATQKTRLRSRLRKVPAVPLIYMNRSVMILEPMSPATEKIRDNIESSKLSGGLNEIDKKHGLDSDEEDEKPKKKRKGPKGPNPLSVKKKSKQLDHSPSIQSTDEQHKRRRKRAKAHSAIVP